MRTPSSRCERTRLCGRSTSRPSRFPGASRAVVVHGLMAVEYHYAPRGSPEPEQTFTLVEGRQAADRSPLRDLDARRARPYRSGIRCCFGISGGAVAGGPPGSANPLWLEEVGPWALGRGSPSSLVEGLELAGPLRSPSRVRAGQSPYQVAAGSHSMQPPRRAG